MSEIACSPMNRASMVRSSCPSNKWEMFIQNPGVDDNTRRVIHWLSRFQNQIQHSALRAIRLPETGEWLLHQALFQSWSHDEKSNNIFWCNGLSGAGKSVIASALPSLNSVNPD